MNIPVWTIQFLAGGLGGLIRGLVGIYKSQTFDPKNFTFDWKPFVAWIVVAVIVGQFAGIVFNGDWRASMMAGYAGSDFIENLYKLSLAKFFK
jgi:hypothetical protein